MLLFVGFYREEEAHYTDTAMRGRGVPPGEERERRPRQGEGVRMKYSLNLEPEKEGRGRATEEQECDPIPLHCPKMPGIPQAQAWAMAQSGTRR